MARRSSGRRSARRVALLSGFLLAAVAVAHPELRLVDFIPFSVRARHLPGGNDLINPLYPSGYPALLLVAQRMVGDVLIAGKLLSVLAGMGLTYVAVWWISPWVGLWLISSAAMLQWGATEGTDLMAASLSIGGLLAVRARPGLAGALLGAACMTRYTAIAALPVALLFGRGRLSLLAAFAVVTVPHWGVALATGSSVLPDQTANFAIGGQREPLLSMHTLQRIPHGLGRAVITVLQDAMVQIGAWGLFFGILKGDRRAMMLAGLALLHLTGVGMAFVNARLVLPASLCLLLGAAWLIPGRLLIPAAVVGLWFNLQPARSPSVVESSLSKVTAQCNELEGPMLTSSPWFHQRKDGWLESGILLRRLGDSRRLDPARLRSVALAWEVSYLALDIGRVRASYPGLAALASGSAPEGFEVVAKSPGWRIYRLESKP